MVNFSVKEPSRPENIPTHAQWLSGKDSGFWFTIDEHDISKLSYTIHCFDQYGNLSFKGLYNVDHPGFNVSEPYSFTHLSHYNYCSISQKNKLYRFTPIHRSAKNNTSFDPSDLGVN